MYYAYQYNGSAVGATLCLCHRAPGTGPAADPDAQGHPTAQTAPSDEYRSIGGTNAMYCSEELHTERKTNDV